MDDPQPEQKASLMERHLQTLLLTIVAGLIAWQGVTSLKLSESSARQDERIAYLTEQVREIHRELREQRAVYVTRGEFERRTDAQDDRLDGIDGRVRALEEGGP